MRLNVIAMNALTSPLRIKWNQIFALAALDAGILISWIAYHDFQPKLLTRFHFESLSGFVSIAQSLVILLVPLAAGWLADYYRRHNGSSFMVFSVGISVASMIFMTVAFTISDQTFVNLVGLLPVLIVFWLISMNVFHSPANSILEAFSKSPQMPLVMSVLAITKEVIHALQPIILTSIERLGGALTFLGGGIVLVVTGVWFSKATGNLDINHSGDAHEKNRFHVVAFIGLLTGLCNSLILHFFPEILTAKFGAVETLFDEHLYVSVMLGVSALATLPLTRLVKRLGVFPSLTSGLLVAFVSMLGILVSPFLGVSLFFSLLMALSYGLILITGFPHALRNINAVNATLGTGVFFASFEFFEVLFAYLSHH